MREQHQPVDEETTTDRRPWWSLFSPKLDRRESRDRRSNPSATGERRVGQRRLQHRRTHPRRLMPFGGVAPSGRLCIPGHCCVHAALVDISEGGTCVLTSDPIAVAPGDSLELTLHESFGSGSIQLELELRWLQETPVGLRLGGRFLDPGFSPSSTFLKTYLETDFGGDRRESG